MKVLNSIIIIVGFLPAFAIACEECWVPKLNFDIEGNGFSGSMIFISGHSYSLTATNEILKRQNKKNFFCKKNGVGSKELVEILNDRLSGVVTAEEVTMTISEGLIKKYPCD